MPHFARLIAQRGKRRVPSAPFLPARALIPRQARVRGRERLARGVPVFTSRPPVSGFGGLDPRLRAALEAQRFPVPMPRLPRGLP